MGVLDAATSDGRVIFILPWQGYTLAGTTDTACEVEADPIPSQTDIDFILKETNKLLRPDSVLTRDDVLASWSGTFLFPHPQHCFVNPATNTK